MKLREALRQVRELLDSANHPYLEADCIACETLLAAARKWAKARKLLGEAKHVVVLKAEEEHEYDVYSRWVDECNVLLKVDSAPRMR